MVSAFFALTAFLILPAVSWCEVTWPQIEKMLGPDAEEVSYDQVRKPNSTWLEILKLLEAKDGTNYSATGLGLCDDSCDRSKVTLTAGSADKNTSTPTTNVLNFISFKCRILSVKCQPVKGGTTFMQFNTKDGGPAAASKSPIYATLQCRQENGVGVWKYKSVDSSESRIINEINCVNS